MPAETGGDRAADRVRDGRGDVLLDVVGEGLAEVPAAVGTADETGRARPCTAPRLRQTTGIWEWGAGQASGALKRGNDAGDLRPERLRLDLAERELEVALDDVHLLRHRRGGRPRPREKLAGWADLAHRAGTRRATAGVHRGPARPSQRERVPTTRPSQAPTLNTAIHVDLHTACANLDEITGQHQIGGISLKAMRPDPPPISVHAVLKRDFREHFCYCYLDYII